MKTTTIQEYIQLGFLSRQDGLELLAFPDLEADLPEGERKSMPAAHVKENHVGTKWRRDGEDMSKGIATQRPDNSVAHLDEDLLADDA